MAFDTYLSLCGELNLYSDQFHSDAKRDAVVLG